ncbi:MAG: hypothetical protein H6707_16385 [Deltaproteobacteria bacterium]|nr:hypothetical protein [Deltaproteobacteria bacterium]
MRKFVLLVVCPLVLLVPGLLSAKSAQPTPTEQLPANADALLRRAVQRMIFEDDLVSAGRAIGGGTMISMVRPTRLPSLRLVRESFIAELLKSADLL